MWDHKGWWVGTSNSGTLLRMCKPQQRTAIEDTRNLVLLLWAVWPNHKWSYRGANGNLLHCTTNKCHSKAKDASASDCWPDASYQCGTKLGAIWQWHHTLPFPWYWYPGKWENNPMSNHSMSGSQQAKVLGEQIRNVALGGSKWMDKDKIDHITDVVNCYKHANWLVW